MPTCGLDYKWAKMFHAGSPLVGKTNQHSRSGGGNPSVFHVLSAAMLASASICAISASALVV